MKYLPSLTICALMFLPTQVEGTLLILFVFGPYLLSKIFFPERRNDRDCNSLRLSTGLNITLDTEQGCGCFLGDQSKSLFIVCGPIKDTICLTPSDALFCSPATSDNSYSAYSTSRKIFQFSTPPSIESESLDVELKATNFSTSFSFRFDRGDGSSPSKKYTRCSVTSKSYVSFTDVTNPVNCTSCDICENGVDFKYDCSNANGTFAFSNVTNTTVLVPGPKVESCFPVVDLFPY